MQDSEARPKIHLWFPNIFDFKGGIQVYSAFLMTALQSLYPDSNYSVFLKHDVKRSIELNFSPKTQFYFTGWVPHPLRTLAFGVQLLGHGLRQHPDLVIATHVNFTVIAHLLKRFTGIPYWAVAHGIDVWELDRPAVCRALRNADRILAVSGYTRDRLLKEQDLDPDQIALLPNTFDPSRFRIAAKPAHLLQRYQLTPEQPVILTVARLAGTDRRKGYDQIIEALPQIRQQLPNVRYLLAGKGDDQPRIEQLVRRLNLEQHVTLAGFVPDRELAAHYNLCDVFAMPSKQEGFGIVYLEALASGKPTVGGNQDGAVDALCHGELGVLVHPDDVPTIAQTLTEILLGTYPHPLLYQPELLRQKVIETFGFDRFRQTLQTLIQQQVGATR
jgi:glycosyltransferase involved in cell wall biosynthesis